MIYYVMYLIGWARGLIWRAPDVAKAQPFTTSTSTRTSPIEIGAAYLDTRELGLHHLTHGIFLLGFLDLALLTSFVELFESGRLLQQ